MVVNIFRNVVLKKQIIGGMSSFINLYRSHKDIFNNFKRTPNVNILKNKKPKKGAWGKSTIDME